MRGPRGRERGAVGWARAHLGSRAEGSMFLALLGKANPAFSVALPAPSVLRVGAGHGGVSGVLSRNKFSGEQAGWSWQRGGSEPQEL